ncbi:MAG: hypothetical protein ABSG84_06140 [Acidobacteriaceae bacterium]|jgi:hypothetical protein
MRIQALTLLAVFALPFPMMAETFDFNLIDTGVTSNESGMPTIVAGTTDGAASFTLDLTPPSTGTETYNVVGYDGATQGVTAMSFTLDGETFDLADANDSNVEAAFDNGVLAVLDYVGTINSGYQFDLTVDGPSETPPTYSLSSNQYGTDTIVQRGNVQPTPEPSGLLLLWTGMAAVAGSAWRRGGGTSRRVRIP